MPTMRPSQPLTAQERELLAFERDWWRHGGTKDSAVRAAFDIDVQTYYAELNRLLDHPGAQALDPLLVRRLRRLRWARRRRRAAARRDFQAG